MGLYYQKIYLNIHPDGILFHSNVNYFRCFGPTTQASIWCRIGVG
jgi:hypothetical protein